MASFDSNTGYKGSYIQLVVNPRPYSVDNNTTVVDWEIWVYTGTTYWQGNAQNSNLYINGGDSLWSIARSDTYAIRTWYKLGTGSKTIHHNTDGTKTIALSAALSIRAGGAGIGSVSINTSMTLPTIPRTSTFTAPSSFTMGDAFEVSITRASSSFTHWVRLSDGSVSLFDTDSNVGTSQSVNVALSTLAARSPNAMSRTFTVTVWTYNGDTIIGSTSTNITANVPSSVKPTFSAVTVSENVSTVASLVGAYVQTKSRLNLTITGASGIYGSTIRSYNITGVCHNVNSSSTVTDYLSVSGDHPIIGTVIDSRGQTFEKLIVVNILPYTPPTLNDLSFRRTLPDKTEAPLGDNVTVRSNVEVQSLIVNGVEKNSIWYQVQSAQSGGSFADKANTTSTDLTKSYSDVWVGYSVDHSYNFRVRAGDVFDWVGWSVGVVPTGIVTQQWGSKTTSFGKMIDDTSYNVQVGTGGIQSDGPIIDKVGNEVFGAADYPIEIGTNANGTYEKWDSGTLIQKKTVALASGASAEWVPNSHYKYIVGSNWVFPIPFLNRQIVLTGSLEDYAGVIMHDNLQFNVVNGVFVLRPAPWSTATSITLRAEGRWK